MKATLDIVIFLVTSIAVGAGTVAAVAVAVCAVSAGGCYLWMRSRK